ncbi:hypothetical protein [Butyrivibrio sp. FC2001]|uniref:hypothetical protein n=1 Tax=Butyrivibrio sp. FC2001 TaxID=1280671 RepID=UPI00041F6757|nr:hypothetical protein [Butyrivibrio sp. FC2001]
MAVEKVIKSNQEQAVASWVNYLNQLRLDRLVEFMQNQDLNLQDSMADLDKAFSQINDLISSNRGGEKGLHGFIAEAAEVGIGNARENILGNPDKYTWLNDNGVSDLLRDGVELQQKFYQSDLSLRAIAAHLEKYPDYISNGGKYQIPKDQYEKIQELLSISKDEANKMPTSDGTFSLKQWKMVHDFFESREIRISDVEPSKLEYKEVQREQIEITIKNEKHSLKDTDSELRNQARKDATPTLNEAVKVVGVAAALEGGTALTLSIVKKKKEGKNIKDFSSDDWKEIFKDAGVGTVKGGIRGASIYALTNYTATPAAMANAIVTASFGVAEQAHLYRKGELDETQFISNAEMLCLDASISAISSFIGQAVIPIPIVGALIGNTVGTTLYKIAKDGLSDKERELIKSYLDDIETLRANLDRQYQDLVAAIQKEYETYMLILEKLYSVDYMKAFEGSCEMAKLCGVPSEEILDSKESIADYFLS